MMKVFFVLIFALSLVLVSRPAVAEVELAKGATPVAPKDEATPKLAEDQIPLTIDATKKVAEAGSTSTKAMMSMVVIVILLGSSFYFVRRYKTSNTINKSNMQIKVLSQHYLGPKKSLAIIHVAGESILVGVTDHNISMIKSLALIDDEVPVSLPNTFGQTLAKTEANTEVEAQTEAKMTAPTAFELDEEFSFSNVTENVSKKIKSMRSFS